VCVGGFPWVLFPRTLHNSYLTTTVSLPCLIAPVAQHPSHNTHSLSRTRTHAHTGTRVPRKNPPCPSPPRGMPMAARHSPLRRVMERAVHTHTLTHSHTLALTHSHTLTHSLTRTHSLTLSHTHTHTHKLTDTLTHTHTHTGEREPLLMSGSGLGYPNSIYGSNHHEVCLCVSV
jgi:hypothetical protein